MLLKLKKSIIWVIKYLFNNKFIRTILFMVLIQCFSIPTAFAETSDGSSGSNGFNGSSWSNGSNGSGEQPIKTNWYETVETVEPGTNFESGGYWNKVISKWVSFGHGYDNGHSSWKGPHGPNDHFFDPPKRREGLAFRPLSKIAFYIFALILFFLSLN